MATQIQIRRDTQANWDTANPTLAEGEFGLVTSSNKIVALKVGDGSSAWKALEFSLPVMSGVDNTLEPNDAGSAPINQVTTFSLKGVSGQTSQMLGIKKHDGTVTFSVDQDGDVVVKGDITMDALKSVELGDVSVGDTSGVAITTTAQYGYIGIKATDAAGVGDNVIRVIKDEADTFIVETNGDVECNSVDASGAITTTSNVSAVNVTGSGVLNMSATAGQHNLNDVLDMNTKKIIGVVNPTAGSQEAATANYVDAAITANKGWKYLATETASNKVADVSFSVTGDNYAALKVYIADAKLALGTTVAVKLNSTTIITLNWENSQQVNGWVEVHNTNSDTAKLWQHMGVQDSALNSWHEASNSDGQPILQTGANTLNDNITSIKFNSSQNMWGTFHLYGLLI